jgi:hypothetical protein
VFRGQVFGPTRQPRLWYRRTGDALEGELDKPVKALATRDEVLVSRYDLPDDRPEPDAGPSTSYSCSAQTGPICNLLPLVPQVLSRPQARRCTAHGQSRTARRLRPAPARRRRRPPAPQTPERPGGAAPPRPTPSPPRRPTYRHTTKLLTDESIARPADRALAEARDSPGCTGDTTASSDESIYGGTSLAVMPKRPSGRTDRAGTARHTPLA